MATVLEKLKDLKYNELITLAVIEWDDDLRNLFNEEIKMPFSILYRLQKENKLNDETKELLVSIFESLILTKSEYIDRYERLLAGEETAVREFIERDVEEEPYEETVVVEKPKAVKPKAVKENKLPRRYGKASIEEDIKRQGGIATPIQRAMLRANDLKNMQVNLSAIGVKQMCGGQEILSEEDCRKITAAVTTMERLLQDILKPKTKRKIKK